MEIKCTVSELKELTKEKSVAGTTDISVKIGNESLGKIILRDLANRDKVLKD